MKVQYSLLTFLGLLSLIITCIYFFPTAVSDEITVDDDGNAEYTTIQDAIDASTDGDTICVWDGIYHEKIEIWKKLSVIGNGSENTFIDGGGEDYVVSIRGNYINFSGFTVYGSGDDWNHAGINVWYADNNTVSHNNCSNNKNGIRLQFANYNNITNNNCSNNIVGKGNP